jgi:dipeptidyl aminopeptidase/acylaminoacyl peptidase
VLWLAARGGLPRDAPGAGPRVLPRAVLAQAPSTDLRRATLERVDTQPSGTPASELLIGGPPAEFPERYELASPAERPPYGPDLPVLLVHGDVDTIVPVAFSRAFQAERAELGDDVRLVEYPGVGHFELIDPAHDAWRRTAVDFLAETVFDPA